jgi:hypothetical protein
MRIDTQPGHTERTIFADNGTDTMPFFDQGSSNGCGTTSLAMIASYLTGRHVDRGEIDRAMRRMDIFSAPDQLVDVARGMGLEARMYNDGSFAELERMVAAGVPCQAIISADGSGDLRTLHYVAVVGHGRDDETGEEYVMLHDPNFGDDPATAGQEGGIVRMPRAQFEDRWSRPPAGLDRFFIAYAPGGTWLPPGRTDGIEGTLMVAGGLASVVNGLDRLASPLEGPDTVLRGAFELSAGVVQTLRGGLWGGVQLAGDWIDDHVDLDVVEDLGEAAADARRTVVNVARRLFGGW